MNQNSHKKKKKFRSSYIWAGTMAVCALAALFAAVWVVINVYEKIAGDSQEWVKMTSVEETTTIEINPEEIYGWITDSTGSRYREDDGSFASNAWKIWNGHLYYLKEDTYMAREEINISGQVFSFQQDGALKDIRFDRTWRGLTGDDNLQNLNSLVKSNEFWCYLSSDIRYTGAFKPICYRITTETKEQVLGGLENPEISTANSLQIHHGYIYYLPQVSSGVVGTLSPEEQQLCNKLFRMKPGSTGKELVAENVTGYLVWEDGTVYYASNGEIKKAEDATLYLEEKENYRISVRDNNCYLVNSVGDIEMGDETGYKIVEDRVYRLDNGKIAEVFPAERRVDNIRFSLEGDPQSHGGKAIYRQENGGEKQLFAQSAYGIDSFCIAEGKVYYSAYTAIGENNVRYSEIYRMNPDGTGQEKISGRFMGNIINLYYYEGKEKIYGEYLPSSWQNCYGQIVALDLDGTLRIIDDTSSRGTLNKDNNDLLSLCMVEGNIVTTMMKTCSYTPSDGSFRVISEKPYQFSDTLQTIISGASPEENLIFPSENETENQESQFFSAQEELPSEEKRTQESPPLKGSQEESQTRHTQETRQTEQTQETKKIQETRQTEQTQETKKTQETRQAEQTREAAPIQESRETRETTAPSVPTTAQESSNPIQQPGQVIVQPSAEPGHQSPIKTERKPESGDSNSGAIPTVEAKPEQNSGISSGNPSEDIQYIGSGGGPQ